MRAWEDKWSGNASETSADAGEELNGEVEAAKHGKKMSKST